MAIPILTLSVCPVALEPPKNTAGLRRRVSLVVPATLRNYAVSAGLGLILFSDRTTLPSVVIMTPYILLFDLFTVHGRKKFTQN